MIVPEGVKTFEGELATFWFDENGILCANAKRTPRTLENQRQNYELIKEITGRKRVCLLSDTTHGAPQDKQTREYMASELPKIFKAMAVISESAAGGMIASTFLVLQREPIPIHVFKNEKDAREWLKQFT